MNQDPNEVKELEKRIRTEGRVSAKAPVWEHGQQTGAQGRGGGRSGGRISGMKQREVKGFGFYSDSNSLSNYHKGVTKLFWMR